MPAGRATLDFGSGTGEVTTSVTGQIDIVPTSLVEVWVLGEATAEHPTSDILVERPIVLATDIVSGDGFTIQGTASENPGSMLYGTYTIGWVWV